MKKFNSTAHNFILGITLALSLTLASKGAVIINVIQTGPDVVISTPGGSLNVNALFQIGSAQTANPSTTAAYVGETGGQRFTRFGTINTSMPVQSVDLYSGFSISQANSTDVQLFASSGTGPVFYVQDSLFGVPTGYSSGDPIAASSATITGTNFTAMGLTEGDAYVYSWGSGANADNITVNIVPIPEPAASVLFGLGCVGLLSRRRR